MHNKLLRQSVESFLDEVVVPLEDRWEAYFVRRGIGWPSIEWRFIPSEDLRSCER